MVLLGGLWVSSEPVWAQTTPNTAAQALTSDDRPVRIAVRPEYRRFVDNGQTLAQWSFPVSVVVPFRERWQVSLQGGAAVGRVGDLPDLSGPTDVQAALSYARPAGDGSVIINATASAPTGKHELNREEFIAATFLSQRFYQFPVSSVGQGFGSGASITWATPLSESVVVGLGGAFRYHSEYDPVAGRTQQYNPGNEGRLTTGIDIQVSRLSAVSADLSLVLYGTDTLGGVDQFNTGHRASIRVQYLRRVDGRTLRIVGRYRQQEKSTLPLRLGSDLQRQVLPSQGGLRGTYTTPLSGLVDVRVTAAGRWYGETTAFDRKTLGKLGAEMGIGVGRGVEVAPQIGVTVGSFSGLVGGMSLTAEL